jgi:hypothetical protein
MAPSADVRAALVEELVAERDRFDGRWWLLIEAAPEIAERALTMIEAIPDEGRRLEELSAILEHIHRDRAKEICTWMLEVAERDRGSPRFTRTLGYALDALSEMGCEALLGDDRRREIVDALLANEERDDLWSAIAEFVPDDRASAVLAVSRARLAVATHYAERDKWLAVGLAVLARAPAAQAAEWREVAAAQLPGTAIESYTLDRFAPWSPEQRRAIVLARLAQHQHELLPQWLLEPWRHVMRERRAVEIAADPEARADARRVLDALTARTAWPSSKEVHAVLDALERCAGADAVARVCSALDA